MEIIQNRNAYTVHPLSSVHCYNLCTHMLYFEWRTSRWAHEYYPTRKFPVHLLDPGLTLRLIARPICFNYLLVSRYFIPSSRLFDFAQYSKINMKTYNRTSSQKPLEYSRSQEPRTVLNRHIISCGRREGLVYCRERVHTISLSTAMSGRWFMTFIEKKQHGANVEQNQLVLTETDDLRERCRPSYSFCKQKSQ